jgi:hypothetical protein
MAIFRVIPDARVLCLAGFLAGVGPAVACGPFFYEAPPSLEAYPERYGIRTWREIFPEKYPQSPGALTQAQLEDKCRALASEFAPDAAFLQKLDALAEANRVGDYRVRYANLLNEMRELATAKDADPAATRAYLDWRIQHLADDDGFIHAKPPPWKFFYPEEDRQKAEDEWARTTQETLADIDQHLAASPAFLAPNWLVQRGAWLFRRGDFAGAAADFDAVLAKYPGSPRAEVAQFMRARCAIEQSRQLLREAEWKHDGSGEQAAYDERRKAADLLAAYERDHPHGRFLAEAIGWEGAIASDAGDYAEAVRDYLRQIDAQPTREVIRSALRECDRCFAAALEKETGLDEFPFDAIARNPAAAMSLIYLCTDPGARTDFYSGEDYSGGRDALAEIQSRVVQPRRHAAEALLRLGAEIGKNEASFSGKEWRAIYLAALARIAMENGEPGQALRLTELGKDVPDPAGDLLLARGLALEHLEKWAAAAEAYEKLRALVPGGPLSVDLTYRIARCQRHVAQQGLAAIELAGATATAEKQSYLNEDEAPSFPALRSTGELEQWTDALLQFAPLDELEAAARRSDIQPEFAQRLRSMIRCRALTRGDYARAEKWLETGENPHSPDKDSYESTYPLQNWAWMDRSRWNELVEPLRAGERAIRVAADPDAKTRALLDLGAQWERVRGKVTSPSLDPLDIFNSQPEIADVQRRKNALQLALTSAQASEELDRRDEDAHALRAYLAAANIAPSKELKARALAAANNCLLRMAQLTPYQADRAFERDDARLSREIFQRLKQECTGTPETDAAVFYGFPSASERGEWMPGDYVFWRAELAVADAFAPRAKDKWDLEEAEWNARDTAAAFHKKLIAVADTAGTRTLEQLRADLAAIRAEFLPKYDSAHESPVMNDLDDLALFLDLPGVTPAMCAKYFPIRVEDGDIADSPDLAPASDFLAFLRTLRIPRRSENENGDGSVYDWQGDAEGWRAFLREFPHSPKAEAARLRLARAIYHTYRTHIGVESYDWPAAPTWGGYKRMVVERDKPFDAVPIFAALDDYDRLYPHGRYAAEIRLMRGGASLDSGDYATAIANLTAILDDPTKRDLHFDAALELAEGFSRLADAAQRPRILAALRDQPRGIAYLRRFLESETLGSLLRPMEPFFRETLGAEQWDTALAKK